MHGFFCLGELFLFTVTKRVQTLSFNKAKHVAIASNWSWLILTPWMHKQDELNERTTMSIYKPRFLTNADIVLSGEVTDTEYEVHDVVYRIHRKRDADEDAPRCLRVDYMIGLDHWQSEFICVEYTGYARRKAEAWWRERCINPCPETVEEALDMADMGLLATPLSLVVRSIAGQKYDRIIKQTVGDNPNSALEEAPF